MDRHITGSMSVADVVSRYPQTRQFLEESGIDYCCGGRQPLKNACENAGRSYNEIKAQLEQLIELPRPETYGMPQWLQASAGELVDHIVATHHSFMKEQLPRLTSLLDKVYKAHHARHGETIRQLQWLYERLRMDIEMHLAKEEQVLFPMIKEMEAFANGQAPMPEMHCGTVQNPIRQMESEHDTAGGVLAEMRTITSGYLLPDDACETFKALYDGLKAMEDDLHQHIHLENNILFGKAVELESRVCQRSDRS